MKLSIIIPVYNEIKSLKIFTSNLINSFSNQDVEYIFINDGSNDGSENWLKKYPLDKDLQLLHEYLIDMNSLQ